jgi:hypothetical protein
MLSINLYIELIEHASSQIEHTISKREQHLMNRIGFSERTRSNISKARSEHKFGPCHTAKAKVRPFHAPIDLSSSIFTNDNLLFSLERIGETTHVLLEISLVAQELHVGTIVLESSLATLLDVVLAGKRCEAPVLRRNDLLTAGELVLSAAESLDGGGSVLVTGTDTEDDLANVDTGDKTVGLAERTTHSCLQSIGTGT